MSQYKTLTDTQEKFLLKCTRAIEKECGGGTSHVYQWELESEMRFINKILSNRVYDLFYDSDRLNSLGNLYGYIKKGV
jgi:hypothetical protein